MKNTFINNLVYIYGVKILVLVLGFLSGIILARYLGPDVFGALNSLIIFPVMISNFAELGVRQAIIYFIGQKKFEESDIIGNIVVLFFIASLTGVSLCVLILYLAYGIQYNFETYILIALLIPPQMAISYSNGFLLGKQEIKKFGQVTFLPNLLRIIAILILVVIFNMGLIGGVLSLLISTVLIAGIYSKNILSGNKPLFQYNPLIIKSLISNGALYAVSLVIITLNYKVDIYLLKILSSNYQVGQYSVSVSICDFILQIPFAIGILLFAKSAGGTRSKEYLNKVILLLKISFILFLILTISWYFLSDYFISVFYGATYLDSINSLKILLISIDAIIIFKILSMDMAGIGKPHLSLFATVPGLIINVVLNLIWIPKFGGTGAAYSTLVSYIFVSVTYAGIYSLYNKLNILSLVTISKADLFLAKSVLKGGKSAQV